jgi:predicted GNAT superfamily acetyltransferase
LVDELAMSVEVKLVETFEEIKGVKHLHDKNLKKNLTPEQQAAQGFVTFEYDLDFLEAIHRAHPSVIAVDEGVVVGYVLVVTRESQQLHPLITEFVQHLSRIKYKGQLMDQLSFCLVGQLCVAQSHTGQGLVQRMYNAYKDQHSTQFDYLVTDVDAQNVRSLKAHLKTGFEVVGSLAHEGSRWEVILWDWNKS